MNLTFARNLRQKVQRHIGRAAYNSVLYGWSLGGTVPDKLLFSPCDLWPGSEDAGRWLIHSGIFTLEGDQLELHNADWHPRGVEDAWIEHIHGFGWLRDLRALGGKQGRGAARAMVESWIYAHHGWHEIYWRPDILGRRISNWLAAYDFFGESADEDFQHLFFESVMRQLRHLGRATPGALSGVDLLHATRGLIYAGLALEGREACLEQGLNLLDREIDKQILSDGGHITRNPQALLETIQMLIDVRAALRQGGYPCPEKIQHALDRAVPALRFFRHGDHEFALFNGAQEGNADTVKQIFMQAGSRAKSLGSLSHTGYERVQMGRSLLLIDSGRPPVFPHDEKAHAAPLSFEFSYGRERVFVNCGSHPTCPDWQDALRSTPAHNALTIDDRNICEIHADRSMGRKPRTVMTHREDVKTDQGEATLIEVCHDGYVPLNGITHRRRFYMADKGGNLRGEDNLTCSVGLGRVHKIAIRFHIHPSVKVSLVQDGDEALLRTPSGIGWRFTASGDSKLSLENSVYLGEGIRPRKTNQLVIHADMAHDTAQFKWALQRE